MGWFGGLFGGGSSSSKPKGGTKPKAAKAASQTKKSSTPVAKAKPTPVNRTSGQAGQSKPKTTPAYQPGNPGNKTALVLSAPGQAEKKAGHPAAGQTGTNLNKLLQKAHAADPKKFPSAKKEDYTIVNATEKVHYGKATGDTEGSRKEIANKANRERVQQALKDKERAVAFGKKAEQAVALTDFKKEVITASHPSNQNLNRNYRSDKATPQERANDRMQQYTDDLLKKD